MCEPASIGYVAVAVVAAVTGYAENRQTAKRQDNAIRTTTEMEQMDLNRQADQMNEAARAQMNDAARKATHDQALFDVVAGEYGGGNSVDRARTIGDIQSNENLSVIATNSQNAASENGFAHLATTAQANAKLAAINQPSGWGTALQIGGAATKAYADYLPTTESYQQEHAARRKKYGDSMAEWSRRQGGGK